MPPQDLLNHPTTPCSLEACKLAEPQTVQASPLQRKSNGRELRQVVSRFIRSSAATILPSDFEEKSERASNSLCHPLGAGRGTSLASIINDGSWRNRAVAMRDRRAEP